MAVLPSFPRLPDGQLDGAKICPTCTRCCRSVLVEIEVPDNVTRVTKVLWLLYHKAISVYIDWQGDWFMAVPTDCENLRQDGLCGIYENRPEICRDYDIEGCEGTSDEPAEKVHFQSAAEFMKWLAREKPQLYKRCLDRGVVPPAIRVPEKRSQEKQPLD